MNNIPQSSTEYRDWWQANTDVPYGYCWCECGEATTVAPGTDRGRLRFKGEPIRFRLGHQTHKRRREGVPHTPHDYRLWWQQQRPDIPYGECWCGCGLKTKVTQHTMRHQLWFAGEPVRYINAHYNRNWGPEYVEEDHGYRTPCWMWLRGRNKAGYGRKQFYVQGVRYQVQAHRYYYEQEYGPIPEGLFIDHLCRVRACVRPSHLEPVTNTTNVRRGNGSKLTAEDVRNIKRRRMAGEARATIANDYGIAKDYIRQLVLCKAWKDVTVKVTERADGLENYETAREVAARLGVSAGRVRQLAIAGRLPGAMKMANQWHVPMNTIPQRRAYTRSRTEGNPK